ncbi:MAG TPA: TetR/AcrR family transcriptional regulator [Candidatus Hydrogenedentes bacterium]|nr:TetR/AcrR family transcriptional regulator [Candidatus Hydrogenedentota bacterium]
MNTDDQNLKTLNPAEEKLLASALKLFSEKGYEGTSIREIIEGAGVTRPVLYYYFENKEALFCRVVEQTFRDFTSEISDIRARIPGCKERLKAIIVTGFELTERNPEGVRLILQVLFSPPQQGPKVDQSYLQKKRFRLIEEVMTEGLANNEICGGDAQSLALAFLGLMDMYIMAKNQRPSAKLSKELGEGLVDLLFYGAVYRESPPTALNSPYAV